MIMRCPTCAADIEASNHHACPVCCTDISPPTASAGDPAVQVLFPLTVPALGSGVLVGGRYRVVRHLRSGGMGSVYPADDLKLNVPVALKFLSSSHPSDPRLLDLLLNEVRLA